MTWREYLAVAFLRRYQKTYLTNDLISKLFVPRHGTIALGVDRLHFIEEDPTWAPSQCLILVSLDIRHNESGVSISTAGRNVSQYFYMRILGVSEFGNTILVVGVRLSEVAGTEGGVDDDPEWNSGMIVDTTSGSH